MRQASLALPLFLIIFGAVWLLKTADILPETSTLVAAGIAATGVIVLVTDGINKQSVVSGPFLVYIGAAVYLYHRYYFAFSPLIAMGMVVLGLLLLLSRSNVVPVKEYRPRKAVADKQE
ncbi:hypothetical protein [Neisseria sp.]|uniref:hypothetical protein n=1 Tax=Neisseria sp. TaxID=192066 RepID=UPI0035A1A387